MKSEEAPRPERVVTVDDALDAAIRCAFLEQMCDAYSQYIASRQPLIQGNERKQGHTGIRRAVRVISLSITVLTLVMGIALASSREVREMAAGFLVTKQEGNWSIQSVQENTIPGNIPDSWLGCYWLTDTPEGFRITDIKSLRLINEVTYKDAEGLFIAVREDWTGGTEFDIQSQEPGISVCIVNRSEALCHEESNGVVTILWQEGGCVETVSTNLGPEEAVRLAEAIRRIF